MGAHQEKSKGRSVETVVLARRQCVVEQTEGLLREPLKRALDSLATRMKALYVEEDMHWSRIGMGELRFPSETWILGGGGLRGEPISEGHVKKARLEIDEGIVDEISSAIGGYTKCAPDAMGELRLSNGTQSWSPDVFDTMLAALEKESLSHTAEIKALLDTFERAFREARSYNECIGIASTLRSTLTDVTKVQRKHLEEVARVEFFKMSKPQV